MNTKVEHLTSLTFKEKVFDYEKNQEWQFQGKLPAIVDFYADWCGPCKMIGPLLEELQEEYNGKITIYKVNTEQERELSSVFGIRSIPSLLFIPMGEQPRMAMGAMPKNSLKEMIHDVLKVDQNGDKANSQ